MRRVKGLLVTERTWRKALAQMRVFGYAVLVRRWHRFAKCLDLSKPSIKLLQAVVSPEAVTAAKQSGDLVMEATT